MAFADGTYMIEPIDHHRRHPNNDRLHHRRRRIHHHSSAHLLYKPIRSHIDYDTTLGQLSTIDDDNSTSSNVDDNDQWTNEDIRSK